MSMFDSLKASNRTIVTKTETQTVTITNTTEFKAEVGSTFEATIKTEKPKAQRRSLVHWGNYASVLFKYAKDFQLTNDVNEECRLYKFTKDNIDGYMYDNSSSKAVQRQYCNKTGQMIGLIFGVRGESVASSIAPQWLNTGVEALKRHAQSSPIAYTVFSFDKFFNDAYDSDSTLVKHMNVLNAKIRLHEFMIKNKELIQMLQFVSFVISKTEECNKQLYSEVLRYCNDVALLQTFTYDVPTFLKCCGELLKMCFNGQNMLEVNSEDDFDKLENWIHKFIQRLNTRRYGKTTDQIMNTTIYSNFSTTAKVMSAVKVAKVHKEMKVNAVVAGMGDIF